MEERLKNAKVLESVLRMRSLTAWSDERAVLYSSVGVGMTQTQFSTVSRRAAGIDGPFDRLAAMAKGPVMHDACSMVMQAPHIRPTFGSCGPRRAVTLLLDCAD